MKSFVDHLQILPVPSRGGVRQPDGDHRPGGLGMLTVADRLAARGWTARVEDIGFDKRLPEKRIAESYARAIGDAVLSAWDRSRFPIVLGRVGHAALGVIDALGERTGVVWVSPRGEYRSPGLLRRPPVERTALALLTGRVERDKLAVRPVAVDGSRVVVLGGGETGADERRAMEGDGIRIVEELADLPAAVRATDADAWYVQVDVSALAADDAPAADEPGAGDLRAADLAAAIGAALGEGTIGCVGLVRYDLNRDAGGRTAESLVEIVEATALAAGGQPRPEEARSG